MFCSRQWRKYVESGTKVVTVTCNSRARNAGGLEILGWLGVAGRLFSFVQFFASLNAALGFNLEILTQGLRHDSGSGEFGEIGDGKLRQEAKRSSESGSGISEQGETDAVVAVPFGMMGDGLDHRFGDPFAGEDL